MTRAVAYYRVSTASQGRSGLGLEAQRQAVEALCASRGWAIAEAFTEVESGKRADRPQLTAALHHAKVTGAVLLVAKLDRLSRNVAFLAALQDSGAQFMAAVAQAERKAISKRTKEALAAAKARGTKLGNPNGAAALLRASKGNAASLSVITANADAHAVDLASIVERIRSEGATSLAAMADRLNAGGFATPRGGQWHPSSVRNLLRRIAA